YKDDASRALRLKEQAHSRFLDVHAIGDEFCGDAGSSEDGADDAGIAVRKRAHGVVHVDRVMRTLMEGGEGLLKGGVGMTYPNNHSGFLRGINARNSSEKFRRDGDDAGMATSGGNKLRQQLGGRQLQPFQGMNAAAHRADERSFEVDP